MESRSKPTQLPAALGGGLLLRRSTAADCEPLAVFNACIHSDDGPEKPDEGVGFLVRDMLSGGHPMMRADDFTVVEERSSGRIVSCVCLISQTWSYAGIPFKVGRPELVATDPDYRNRGLVRRQFEVIHEWSRERGEMVQGITGIPIYYRRFGYEMAMDLGGSRTLYEPLLPKLTDEESGQFTLRKAQLQDQEFVSMLYDLNTSRSLVKCERDLATWRFELIGRNPRNVDRVDVYVLVDRSGQSVGMVTILPNESKSALICKSVDLLPGIDNYLAARSVVHELWKIMKAEAEATGKPLAAIQFVLGRSHMVYDLLGSILQRPREPYAWYLRVPDVKAYLNLIRPALDQRLAQSSCSGFNGKLSLLLEHQGIEIQFNTGVISSIAEHPPLAWSDYDATFPGLTFLQLLFGYRDLTDLERSFVDINYNDKAAILLKALFPVLPSNVWMIS